MIITVNRTEYYKLDDKTIEEFLNDSRYDNSIEGLKDFLIETDYLYNTETIDDTIDDIVINPTHFKELLDND